MNIESAKAKYYGDSSKTIIDGKYSLGSSTGETTSKPYSNSFATESNVTFTPRPKRTPTKVKNPEPKVAVKKEGVNRPELKNTKLHLPEELILTFTAGTVDFSFPHGVDYGFNKDVHDIKVQPDGKIIVAGDFEDYIYSGNTFYSPYLCRLNADGTFDDTFDTTNNESQNAFNNTIFSIHLQEDGKIVVGGDFTYFDRDAGFNCNYIARLNSDGSFDESYFIGNGFDGSVSKVEVQEDGKTVIGGTFTQYNNADYNRIVRLLSNGSIDPTFLVGDGFNIGDSGYVNDIIKQPDGKLLVGGDFYDYDGTSVNRLVRLNTNGTIDTSFNTGNGFNDEVTSIALQSDGKIIVGGFFDYFNYTYLFDGNIVRLSSGGSLDTMFGYGLNNGVISLAIQSDDKILVGGFFGTFYPNSTDSITIDELVRFHKDCTLDTSFYFGELFSSGVYTITILEDDMILIGGEFDTNGDETIWPLNHFGKINNKILEYPYVGKFIDCGLVDTPFPFSVDNYEDFTYVVGSKTPFDENKTYSFENLSNPSQTVCGIFIDEFPSVNVQFKNVAEYDDCFSSLSTTSKLVLVEPYLGEIPGDLELLVSNKFNVGDYLFYNRLLIVDDEANYFHGTFQIIEELSFSGSNIINLVEPYIPYETGDESIEANGQYLITEDCVSGDSSIVLTYQPSLINEIVLAQPNGESPCKYVSFPPSYFSPNLGWLLTYEAISGGTPVLNSSLLFETKEECLNNLADNGVLDTDFLNTGFDGSLVYTTVEQPDGKILVGGNFNQYLEVNVGNFMRINPDGSLDETFYLGQFNDYIRAIALQPDGKILVGGDFTNYDGYNAGRIIRLNSDGTIDSGFTFATEFDGIVRAIAIQKDGKIVVGGGFNNYYSFNCPQIVRLNSDGTPDPTFVMGDGFDGDNVFTINIESIINTPFYNDNGPITYTENIIVGGWFTWYNGTNVGGIVKLSPTGQVLPDFGDGFNQVEPATPRVNQIIEQPDGKLIIIGGAVGSDGNLFDYNSTYIAKNIVRLVKVNNLYVIDNTFTTRSVNDGGGFNNGVISATLLPNGKIMVGGHFVNYYDNVINHNEIPYLVRLNANGTLDETFTFKLDSYYVNKVILLSSGQLLVGGRFSIPYDRLLKLYIGENYQLREFTTCDGGDSFIYLPSDTTISTGSSSESATEIPYEPISIIGLDLAYDGDYDDDNFVIVMPTPFDVTFLGTNYTSVNVSSNPYITFGEGGSPDDCCFDIPNDIPTSTELPGVYLSFACPQEIDDYDGQMYQLYTGLTDGGNTMVIKFIGSDHCDDIATLVYGFKFYKDNSDYFDLVIEENTQFFNDDPTGGVSNGVDETWLYTFDSSPSKAYRIGQTTTTNVKGNVNTTPAVCGQVGAIVDKVTGGLGGSMYFDGNSSLVTIENNNSMDLNFGPWTVEWLQKYTSTDTCCRRVFDIGQNPNEEFGVSIENGDTIILWMASGATTINLNTPVYDTWSYFAISSENLGGTSQVIRVYQDGVIIYSGFTNVDINNFQGDPTVNLPLIIGGGDSGTNSLFEGYITNFRWTKGTNYYNGSTIDVPIYPLGTNDSQLLLLSTDENNLLTNTSNGIPSSGISDNNVIWSSESPFTSYDLYQLTDTTEYEGCDTCDSTVKYKATLYVRDGVNPDKIQYSFMTKSDIDNVLALGPIVTTRGPECYELLKYYL